MGRRIRWLGLVLVVCFLAVIAQLVNVQVRQAPALDASKTNPRNHTTDNFRGRILAADGTTVLAESVPNTKGGPATPKYYRTYPGGSLYSGVVGYDSYYYGTAGTEYVYNTQLSLHSQPAKTLGQLLTPPKPTADDVTLTIQPTLQQKAQQALNEYSRGNKDGAVVVMNPRTGAILAMYSQPYFTPNALSQPTIAAEEKAGKADFKAKDPEGFYPGRPMATFDRFPPGSTFKVVTTAAVYDLRPTLSNFTWGPGRCTGTKTVKGTTGIPGTTKEICNDASTKAAASTCGGTIRQMLPESCDPGYVKLGLQVGGTALYKQSQAFGVNSVPPVDLTSSNVSKSAFPSPGTFVTGPGHQGRPGLALAAFGQGTVSLTPLQDAMIAAGVANTGKVMTPHLLSQIRNAQGGLVEQYKPTVYKQAMSPASAQQVKTLMTLVVRTPYGTAAGVGFPATEQVGAKTGTAQVTTPTHRTDDWMIALAPASDPTVAVAVCVPYQSSYQYGATTAGPVVKAMISATLAEQRQTGLTPSTTPLPPVPPTTTSSTSTTTTTSTTASPTTTSSTTTTTTTASPTTTSSTTTTTTTASPTTTTTTATGKTTGAARIPGAYRRAELTAASWSGPGSRPRPAAAGSSP